MSVLQITIRVAWSLAFAIVAGAILIILHVFDIHPEHRLAFAVLGVIADPKLLEVLQWAAVAVVAVVSAGTYNVVAWRLSKRRIASVDVERTLVTDQPQSITPNFAVERRQIAETEIATLTADEQAALRQMLIIGRPKNLSDQIWQSLEMKTSFVERDTTGPKGIKNEFRSVLEDILNKKNETTIISALQMTVGESGPYFKTEGSVFGIRRTSNLKLENVDRSKSLSDCSIHIMEVVPPTDNEGPWLLKDGITLAAGAYTFVPLVTYGEARDPNKSGSGDTFATLETSTGRPTLDVGPQYTMTLRATAQNTAFCELQCNVWVDDDGRLRIGNATTTTADKPGTPPTDVIDRIEGGVTQQSEETTSPSWFELEQRFRELEAPLQFMRIDGQTGVAGETWRLAGGPSGDAGRRFNAVAAMASTRLFKDFPSEVGRFPDLKSETDPVIRWYKALRYIGGRYKEDHYAREVNDDGSSGGFIFTGSIDQPATASATLCLELASRPKERVSKSRNLAEEPEYIDLHEAATVAYEETRGTKAATIAEGLTRDDILGHYAYALFKGSTLYGKHPPSRKLEPVPKEEYGRSGFSDDYSSLRRHGEDQNLYEDLQIRRSDLLRRITELKDLGAPLSREERARKISEIYGDAVALRNNVFSLRVVDAASEVRMNDLQSLLIEEMRELAPERTINLETINVYNELDHPLCNLQDRTRAMVFSEVLLRVMKILEGYK